MNGLHSEIRRKMDSICVHGLRSRAEGPGAIRRMGLADASRRSAHAPPANLRLAVRVRALQTSKDVFGWT